MDLEPHAARAVLEAYRQVAEASWPELHPTMAERASHWPTAADETLRAELAAYIEEASRPSCKVRLFWKFGPDFRFGGCNRQFAQDAGLDDPAEIIGVDDFDRRLPWAPQAAKYRADDRDVFNTGSAKLDILERQQSEGGITWVRAGKAPIRTADGDVIGIFGMYERLDHETARTLFVEQLRHRQSDT